MCEEAHDQGCLAVRMLTSGGAAAARPGAARRSPHLQIEALEDRNLLSTHFPLDPVQWTALGPAPIVASGELSTGRITAIAAHPTDPNTTYVATAGGGGGKAIDGGGHFPAPAD